MKTGLYENYKFTNLSGGVKLNPQGHTETNKLRGRLRNCGVQLLQPSGNSHPASTTANVYNINTPA